MFWARMENWPKTMGAVAPLVVQIRQIDQPDNGRQVLADRFGGAAAGPQSDRPAADAFLDTMPKKFRLYAG